MTRNRFLFLQQDLLPWTLDHDDNSLPWPEGAFFTEVMAALDRLHPDLGMRFVLTNRLARTEALTGDDVVVVCIRDELCRVPAYAHDVRLVAKTYGVRRTPNALRGTGRPLTASAATLVQEAIVAVRRAPSLLASALRTVVHRRAPRVIDLPLGTYLLDDVPSVPFAERKFDVSFAGSRLNREKESRRRVPTQKMRSREELQRAIADVMDSRPGVAVGVHVIDTFHDASSHRHSYSEMLMNSRMVLCPRGGSLETYRFFEAMRCGAIPISERLPDRPFYTGAPAVRVRRWDELPELLDRLLADPAALQARHQAVRAWWEDRCSPEAVARELARVIETSGRHRAPR